MKVRLVSTEKLSVGYTGPKLLLLKDLDMELNAGEFIGLAGVNGVGKSSFIKTLSGLIPGLSGKIFLEGKELDAYSPAEIATKISLVLTGRFGGFNLKVRDLVAMGQMPYTDAFHRLRDKNRDAIETAIVQMGISGFAEKQLSELSDGMFQKAVIAKALAQQTPVILLDEPTAFLDYASRHQLFLMLKELCVTQQRSVMLSSHDLDLLIRYCDKILLFSEGGAQMLDSKTAIEHPHFRALSGGYLNQN